MTIFLSETLVRPQSAKSVSTKCYKSKKIGIVAKFLKKVTFLGSFKSQLVFNEKAVLPTKINDFNLRRISFVTSP